MIYTVILGEGVIWRGGGGGWRKAKACAIRAPRSQSQVSQSHRNLLHFTMTDHFSGAVTAPAERAASTKTASFQIWLETRGSKPRTELRSKSKAEKKSKRAKGEQSCWVLKSLITKTKVHLCLGVKVEAKTWP